MTIISLGLPSFTQEHKSTADTRLNTTIDSTKNIISEKELKSETIDTNSLKNVNVDSSALRAKEQHKPPVQYEIVLLLPSIMSDADILVDDEYALIKASLSTLTKKIILVKKKNSPHLITIKKNNTVCTKRIFVDKSGLVITPCS